MQVYSAAILPCFHYYSYYAHANCHSSLTTKTSSLCVFGIVDLMFMCPLKSRPFYQI